MDSAVDHNSREADSGETKCKAADDTEFASSATNAQDTPPTTSPEITSDLHNLFSRFEAFNFDDDPQFQAGLSRIAYFSSPNKERNKSTDLLKMKAFYYSKHVEALDFLAYMDWHHAQTMQAPLQQHQHLCPGDASTPQPPPAEGLTPGSGCAASSAGVSDDPHGAGSAEEKTAGNDTGLVTVTEAQQNSTDSPQSETVQEQLSFAEIAELIRNGKPIPGLSQVEVVPTHHDPTPSQLSRVKKPWER